ncbi:5-formyltetrahydrofolate cyclo-ligase [Luteimicrobium subarcticum]|uniref:5-formyltetrahydrofolate cyclo-ligase n=1 Tax=Luteimicrobium subarcticum TaxID=620910 RepID=A0A2M8WSX0_9MICO|nr:5-formyltetrahydrofolate cyclo-ligase [Luteimicrobium subarcticum]PJI94047.1 5-formyltetrahydrofolate cyclo-ligase [Luteimicrobium subarcticum]
MSGTAQPYLPSVGMDPVDAKETLRRMIRGVRGARSERLRREAADRLADVVESLPEIRGAACVATYAARPTEPGTLPLLERLGARGVRVLLPVLGTGLQRNWAVFDGADDLQVRAPGRPPEPGTPELPATAIGEADVVLVPALAVDTTGMRLGQGGGWYDRVLEHVREDARIVALVFPDEVYDADERPLPFEPHDRRVHAVATPAGCHELG